jgi:hypothetical protein
VGVNAAVNGLPWTGEESERLELVNGNQATRPWRGIWAEERTARSRTEAVDAMTCIVPSLVLAFGESDLSIATRPTLVVLEAGLPAGCLRWCGMWHFCDTQLILHSSV